MKICSQALIAQFILLLGCTTALVGQYVRVSPDLELYYEEAGSGRPLILVTGWTATEEFFAPHPRSHGRSRAFVCIDQTPRSIAVQKDDWAEFGDASEVGGLINAVAHDRRAFMREFIPTMMQRTMTHGDIAWVMDQTQKTPNYVAVLLFADGAFADYTEEAKKIDGRIPVLNVLSQAHAGAAKTWLAKNAPHAESVVLGNHMMFREYPDKFNAALDAFFAKLR